MTLFFSLLPLYIFGNLHCMGMCGPLVMLLGTHRYRYFYFLGRLVSFSLAGFIAGELGAVLHLFLKSFFLAEIISIVCGLVIALWGLQKLTGVSWLHLKQKKKPSPLNAIQQWVSTLLLKDAAWPAFLFGFFTVALPCGQTLVVFSACALVGSGLVGLGNGFAFALFTTPSLVLSMHTLHLFKACKPYDRFILGGCSILVGSLACCRGLAEIGWISHVEIYGDPSLFYHLVLF